MAWPATRRSSAPGRHAIALRIDSARLTAALRELVAINSVNPTLVAGAPGEVEIADVTSRLFEEAGLFVERHEPRPGRPSVVGRRPGSGGGPTLMLNAHYDTVGVHGMEAPFAADVRDGRLYGRGAYDMKGSLAACIEAAHALDDAGIVLRGDLVVAAVADEEYASLGTAHLVEAVPVDAAIVTEPTSLDLCVAHRGFTWLEVVTRGRAAHGSRYREGVDANLRMGRVLHRLERLGRDLEAGEGHALLGPPSLHAAILKGGTGLSTYAAECTLKIERRTVPPETQENVEAELDAILAALRDEDPELDVSRRTIFHREPFETSPDAPIASIVREAARHALGREPAVIGDSPWMDSALLAAAGVDTVVIGPAGEGAHAAVEWVDLDSCARLAEILAHAAIAYSGT